MTGIVKQRAIIQEVGGSLSPLSSLILLLLVACASPQPTEVHADETSAASCLPPKLLVKSDWTNVEGQLKSIIPKLRQSTVALYPEDKSRGGSGCIISPDGLILTAAHVVNLLKPGETSFTVVFHDGSHTRAVPLGANFTSDLAILKISAPVGKQWPSVSIANESPAVAETACFLGYPGKRLKGAEAHLRVGFITYKRCRNTKPLAPSLMVCDIPVQPGDSGGPLFSMDGVLVGIASSAGAPLDYNRFVPIEQYQLDKIRLVKKERWGDITKGPTRSKLKYRLDEMGLQRLRKEFKRRLNTRCPEAIKLANGSIQPTDQQLVNFIGPDIEPVTLSQPFSRGKSSPKFGEVIDRMISPAVTTVAELFLGNSRVGYAVAVQPDHIVCKRSILKEGVKGRLGDETFNLTLVASLDEWDLALLKTDGSELIPLEWKPGTTSPGSLIVAYGDLGRALGWGIVSSDVQTLEIVDEKVSPLPENGIVSSHRGPYENVVVHDIPVYANDMGSLVRDLQGNVLGFNIARKNRSQAVMIPAESMALAVRDLMNRAREQEK